MRDPADEGRTHEMTLPGGSGARIGYARVSTPEQDISLQIDALERAGCSRIFQDVASGAKAERKGLDEALAYLRPGDTLVVWKIDRLGRSLAHLVAVVEDLRSRGIGFRSLTDPGMDTTTASGALIFHIFGALAAFERELIRERTKAGLAVAAARGRRGGRRPVVTAAVLKRAKALMHDKGLTVREAAGALKIGKTALYDALRAAEDEEQVKAAKTPPRKGDVPARPFSGPLAALGLVGYPRPRPPAKAAPAPPVAVERFAPGSFGRNMAGVVSENGK